MTACAEPLVPPAGVAVVRRLRAGVGLLLRLEIYAAYRCRSLATVLATNCCPPLPSMRGRPPLLPARGDHPGGEGVDIRTTDL